MARLSDVVFKRSENCAANSIANIVVLKVATVAMEQESARGYETRLRARQRAEEKKKKILADAERKQRELERKTRQEMERTLEEVDRELSEIEESAAENLRKKE